MGALLAPSPPWPASEVPCRRFVGGGGSGCGLGGVLRAVRRAHGVSPLGAAAWASSPPLESSVSPVTAACSGLAAGAAQIQCPASVHESESSEGFKPLGL